MFKKEKKENCFQIIKNYNVKEKKVYVMLCKCTSVGEPAEELC